jgi:hypothetical protein
MFNDKIYNIAEIDNLRLSITGAYYIDLSFIIKQQAQFNFYVLLPDEIEALCNGRSVWDPHRRFKYTISELGFTEWLEQ